MIADHEAMDHLTELVLDFSSSFGVLPCRCLGGGDKCMKNAGMDILVASMQDATACSMSSFCCVEASKWMRLVLI